MNTPSPSFYMYYPYHFPDPYITPPDASIYAAVIGISAGVFGFAVIVIVVLGLLWWAKSRRRTKERFERAETIRSSVRGSVRSKSTMSMLTDTHSKRRLDSLSSSKFGYDDRYWTSYNHNYTCIRMLDIIYFFYNGLADIFRMPVECTWNTWNAEIKQETSKDIWSVMWLWKCKINIAANTHKPCTFHVNRFFFFFFIDHGFKMYPKYVEIIQ